MINNLNIKIFDFIFSTNVGLKRKCLENDNVDSLTSQLDDLINEICDICDFWDEYKYKFNDNCVFEAGMFGKRCFCYKEFPKMTLTTKKEYLDYKLIQLKNSIEDNGEFLGNEFKKITKNILDIGRKEILDYCEENGIIEYKGKVFESTGDSPVYVFFYDNIKAVLSSQLQSPSLPVSNMIVVNGNGNSVSNIEQNINSKNENDDKLFDLVLNKMELLEMEGVSKKKLKSIEKACKDKDEGKVVKFLKEIAMGTTCNIVASGILYCLGLL